MFIAEKNVPKAYYDNYDFRIYSKIIEILYNGIDYNIKEFMNSRQPLHIRNTSLNCLKSYYCQDFPNWLSNKELRIVLKNYWSLMEHRGSIQSIESAINIALQTINTDIVYRLQFINNDSNVKLFVITHHKIYNNKFIYYMFDLVKPIGYKLDIVEISSISSYELQIKVSSSEYREKVYKNQSTDIREVYIEETQKPYSQTLGQYLEDTTDKTQSSTQQ